MARIERQRHLERQAKLDRKERKDREWSRQIERGDVSLNRACQHVLEWWMEPVAQAISEWSAGSPGAGYKSRLAKRLSAYNTELLAYLTTKEVLNHLIGRTHLTTASRLLGQAVEDEAQMEAFAKANRQAFDWVTREIRRRKITSYEHKRAFYRQVMRHKEIPWQSWSQAERIEVGSVLIHIFVKATSMVKFETAGSRNRKEKEIVASKALLTWIEQNRDSEILVPDRHPMIVEPTPWSGPTGGGYLEYEDTIIKGAERAIYSEHLDLLNQGDMSATYGALNVLQGTAYRINKEVLAVMLKVWNKKLAVGKLPPNEDEPFPVYPKGAKSRRDYGKANDIHKNWCKQKRQVHDNNRSLRSKRLAVERILRMAHMYLNEPTLYFPHNLDFRGRFYSLPSDLQPQGVEHARALLKFARGKKVVTDEALMWLQVHGANCYGEDKQGMEGRISWVRENFKMISLVARHPLGPKALEFWSKADKPWMFLAWCFDYYGVLKGEPSYIAVSMDGSCNGLQHFAAMLRDPVAARAVNLEPQEQPQDIYQEVADVVVSKLEKAKGQQRLWAREFLRVGIDRKVCKRSVMVMPYGGTLHATKKYVEEEITKKLDPETFGEDRLKALHWLEVLVHESTREVVKGAALAMDWLQKVAKQAAAKGHHIHWRTPHGFVAYQKYLKSKSFQVQTRLHGSLVRARMATETDLIFPKEAVNGISPNFVHSLDACALALTVQRCRGLDLMMVHDDYGTHAADTPRLAKVLRQVFVDLYDGTNLLYQFREQLQEQLGEEVPLPPEQGKFKVKKVLKSKYFFA
jgi:DNA-directed RNA polymerase